MLISGMLLLATNAPSFAFSADSLIGSRAPEFAQRDINGRYVSITSLRGKVIVLNFWATWCPPCKKEIPGLDRLYGDYRSQGLEVVAVSTDSSERGIKEFLKETPLSYRILRDGDGKISRLYGVYSLPTTFIVDRSGIVIKHFIGEQDWDSPQTRATIESLLKRAESDLARPEAVPVFLERPGNSF